MQQFFFSIFVVFCDPSLKRSFSELRPSWELCSGYVSGLVGGKGGPGWIFENLTWISSDFDLWKFRNHKNFNLTVLETQKELGAEIWWVCSPWYLLWKCASKFEKSYVDFTILVSWTGMWSGCDHILEILCIFSENPTKSIENQWTYFYQPVRTGIGVWSMPQQTHTYQVGGDGDQTWDCYLHIAISCQPGQSSKIK